MLLFPTPVRSVLMCITGVHRCHVSPLMTNHGSQLGRYTGRESEHRCGYREKHFFVFGLVGFFFLFIGCGARLLWKRSVKLHVVAGMPSYFIFLQF